jgi:hypothetical protein
MLITRILPIAAALAVGGWLITRTIRKRRAARVAEPPADEVSYFTEEGDGDWVEIIAIDTALLDPDLQ